MKKIYAVVIVMMLFSVGAFGVIGTVVNAQRDQVTIKETVLSGDKSAAEGLVLETRNNLDHHLFWDTTYQVGEKPVCETEYSFFATEQKETEEYVYAGMDLYADIEYGYDYSSEGEASGLQIAYNKLLNEVQAGEAKSEVVYLKDYWEYYPIRMRINLPNTVWTNDEPENAVGDNPYDPKYVIDKFQDFFKIPVLESDSVTIHVGKKGMSSSGEYVSSDSIGSGDYSMFQLASVSAYTDERCYFTISNQKVRYEILNNDITVYHREYVDTSLIPGGYGIYAFAYGRGSEEYHTGIDADSLQMVFPLERETQVKNMMIRDGQSKMVLLTEENGAMYLRVIELETMEEVQKILLDEEYSYADVHELDDFIAVFYGKKIAVISDGNGVYVHEFTVLREENLESMYNIEKSVDFDGEKLALAGRDWNYYRAGYHTCDFWVAVYDADGLIYYGQYENSLSATLVYNDYYANCHPNDVNPLTVSWQ